MPIVTRGLAIFVLLAVALFCGFGFLATFEPPGWPVLRVGYGLTGLLCGGGIGWLIYSAPARGSS